MNSFSLKSPPAMAVSVGSTESHGAFIGAQLWSTIAGELLTWSGAVWLTSYGEFLSSTNDVRITLAASPQRALVHSVSPTHASSYAVAFSAQHAPRPAAASTQNTKDLNVLVAALNAMPSSGVHGLGYVDGEVIRPGVYDLAGAMTVVGQIEFDALGNPNAVFVIRSSGAFSSAAAASMVLSNGAQACNIFFLCGGAVSFGASSAGVGSFIATGGAISCGDGTKLLGRLLTTAGAIATLNATLVAPWEVSVPVDVGNLQNFVAYTTTGAVGNTGTIAGSGDIGTGSGAIGSGFLPAIGNVFGPDAVNARATFALYVSGGLLVGSQRIVESRFFTSGGIDLGALVATTLGQAVEVRVKVDCGTFFIGPVVLSIDRKS